MSEKCQTCTTPHEVIPAVYGSDIYGLDNGSYKRVKCCELYKLLGNYLVLRKEMNYEHKSFEV